MVEARAWEHSVAMLHHRLRVTSPTLVVFRSMVVFLFVGLGADLAGFSVVASAAVWAGLILAATFLGVLSLLAILIRRDRWWKDSLIVSPSPLKLPTNCAKKNFLVPHLKVSQ